MEIEKRLIELANEKLKKFNKKIIPTNQEILGIKVPVLRNLAKEIAKQDGQKFINNNKNFYFEETMLEGMVIGYLNINLKERLELLDNFLPKIKDWAQCDCSVITYSFVKNNKQEVWNYILKKFNSNSEFIKRFAIVMMLNYFIEENYIEKILSLLANCKSEYYYVNMATAWALSVCFVKFRELTLNSLQNCNLDNFTFNKTISKCVDSYRVSNADKNLLKSLRRK